MAQTLHVDKAAVLVGTIKGGLLGKQCTTKYKWRTIQIQNGSNSIHTIALSVLCTHFVLIRHLLYMHNRKRSPHSFRKKMAAKNPTVKVVTEATTV